MDNRYEVYNKSEPCWLQRATHYPEFVGLNHGSVMDFSFYVRNKTRLYGEGIVRNLAFLRPKYQRHVSPKADCLKKNN